MSSESGHTRTIPATLEQGGDLAQTTAYSPSLKRPGERGMKFEYASGSRPLDGYTIKRGVGIGGFGEVYFALSDAGKEVALKRVKRNLDIEVRGVSQCLNLKHINLIGLFDIKYDDEGGAWVVMEYVSGESLRDVIERNQNGMPEPEFVRWFNNITAGVAYLHDHGIVHRDLKPGNIFCDEETIKIGDYGLSKFISCSRRSGQTESVGTCHYMAPEIGKGVYGKEIDIYALGIILFEMITGRLPFEGESSQEIIMKHLTAEPDLSRVPQPYRAVIRKALFKDPSRRFSTVDEMVAALQSGNTPSPPSQPNSTAGIVTSHMAADPELPPVITDPPVKKVDPIYISDDAPDEMIFGPVRDVPPSQQKPIHPRPGRNAAQRQVAVATPVGTSLPSRVRRPDGSRYGWGSLSDWWNNSSFSSPLKLLLLFGAAFGIAVNAKVFVPIAVVLGSVYLIFLGIRALTETGGQQNGRANSAGSSLVISCRKALQQRPMIETLGQLTGSLLVSSVVAAMMVFLMLTIGDETFRGIRDSQIASRFGWLTAVSIGASWFILTLSKIWERREGYMATRRLAMAVIGTCLGLGAFGLGDYLRVSLPASPEMAAHIIPDEFQRGLLTTDGSPTMIGHMLFFGGLFVILRWWRQADPLRSTRLSILGTAACVLWAWIIPYAQPWGFMIALAASVSVQLSSPWLSRPDRTQLAANVS